ncbi:hypothetical protein VTL71DRAFT_3691 [Oculimacula yallundae]|uniref:Uncharacterized protein n=1 Tax=Oculimacula yallundae TaxID=86028 RepID=A0ABR4C3R7_9HELO
MTASNSLHFNSSTQLKSKNMSSISLWVLEIIAICAALFFLAALCIVLWTFDGRLIFSRKSITLNTIVSILSKTLTLSLMLAVSENLGQWKWIIFSAGKKPLLDSENLVTLVAGARVVDVLDGGITIKEMEDRAENENVKLLVRWQISYDIEMDPLQGDIASTGEANLR